MPLTPTGRSRGRRPSLGVLLAVSLVVVAAGAGVVGKTRLDAGREQSRREATAAVRTFLTAWSRGDSAGTAAVVEPGQRAAAVQLLTLARSQMRVASAAYALTGRVATSGRPGAAYKALVQVRGLRPVSWTGRVPLVRRGGAWQVAFAPEVVHPLRPGGSFRYTRERTRRGRVLFADGQALSSDRDLDSNLRGRVVPSATAAEAAKAGSRFVAGDAVGVTGLERVYNETLGGQPGGSLRVPWPGWSDHGDPAVGGGPDGGDVRTSLSLRVQRAGEAAVAGVPRTGSLVALDTRTGRVLALVNAPPTGFNRAIAGKGPPGVDVQDRHVSCRPDRGAAAPDRAHLLGDGEGERVGVQQR